MKILKTFLLTFVATITLASCGSDDPKQTLQYAYNNDITLVTDRQTNTMSSFTGAGYIIDYNLISGKADVEISGLRLVSEDQPITLKIQQATYGQDQQTGATIISVPNAVSVVGGVEHTISNFRLSQTIVVSPVNTSLVYYSISYEVDNRYSVVGVQRSATLTGTTVITLNADGSKVSESKKPYYRYELDRKTSTATITAYYFDCEDQYYPELTFENLPYTLTPTGISINVEEDVTAKQLSATATPFVAKAISLDSRYTSSTQLRIKTDNSLVTASISITGK